MSTFENLILIENLYFENEALFAVIMETTGDMSVIKNNNVEPDRSLFDDIRDSELLIGTGKNGKSSV